MWRPCTCSRCGCRGRAACRWDTIYKLVSTLDACIRARTVSDKHLADLQQACQPFAAAPARARGRRSGTAMLAADRAGARAAATSAAQRPRPAVSGAGSTRAGAKRPRAVLRDSDSDSDDMEGVVLARAGSSRGVRQVLDDDDIDDEEAQEEGGDEEEEEEEEGETGGGLRAKDDDSIQRSAAGAHGRTTGNRL